MFTTKNYSQTGLAIALAAAALSPAVHAQTCTEPTASQFKVTTLVGSSGLAETSGSDGPVQIAVASDRKVFVARMRTGTIKMFNPTDSTFKQVGVFPTYFDTEDGLLGIAVPPDFATTKWVYAFGTDANHASGSEAHVLSRYTLVGDTLINRKEILRIRRHADTHHAAGGIAFDSAGVLVIGTGDNSDPHNSNNNGYGPIWYPTSGADAQKSSSNSNDLRGKVLRIKPVAFADATTPAAGEGTTYTIPTGNLWEYIDKPSFNPNWNTAFDTLAKVRKEIYAMGARNPYHPRVDSRSGWIFWGDVSPDAANNSATQGTRGYDEWNLAPAPGFYGHPYCNGKNLPYNQITTTSPKVYGAAYNCAATQNVSPNNTGIRNMPPAVPAVLAYAVNDNTSRGSGPGDSRFGTGNETAISGPMYRYNPNLASTVKFPPYYEGKIFFLDWSRYILRWITVKPNGTVDTTAAAVTNFAPTGIPSGSYIDAQFGPEGALYLLKFSQQGYTLGNGSAILRVEYTGTYDNSCYQPFNAVTAILPGQAARRTLTPMLVNGMVNLPIGYRSVALYNLSGRKVWSYSRASGTQSESVRVPAELAKGVLQAKLIP
jgi:cytochrome c